MSFDIFLKLSADCSNMIPNLKLQSLCEGQRWMGRRAKSFWRIDAYGNYKWPYQTERVTKRLIVTSQLVKIAKIFRVSGTTTFIHLQVPVIGSSALLVSDPLGSPSYQELRCIWFMTARLHTNHQGRLLTEMMLLTKARRLTKVRLFTE